MKPNFALNFSHDSISLLHRTARGWLEVGATALDAPDLGEALSYLRRSALGLAPHGVAAKLVIPNTQILYTEVDAPGPDDAHRQAQIRRALEGMTPYEVDELVFDWSGEGPRVQVAVVARETLQEAEGFAAQHRFNPLSFVAIPEGGQFRGEPWFGPSALASELLPEGETVERDGEAVQVISRDTAHRASRATSPEPETAPAAPEAEAAPQAEPRRARRRTTGPEVIPPVAAPARRRTRAAAEPPAAPEPLPVEDQPPTEAPSPIEPPLPEAQPVEPPPVEIPAAEPPVEMPVELPVLPEAPPEIPAEPEPWQPEPFEGPDLFAPEAPPQAAEDPVPTGTAAFETPQAEAIPVAEAEAEPAPEVEAWEPGSVLDPGIPEEVPPAAPTPAFASRRQPPAGPEARPAPKVAVTSVTTHRRAPPAPLTPPPLGASAAVAQPYDPGRDDWGLDDPDLPPAPAPAIQTARLAAQRPGGAGPGTATRPAPAKAPGGMVTAPGIPGFGPRKAKAPKGARQAADTLVAPPPGGGALRMDRPAGRGKPRFLGLILTVALLLALAAIAAWSSFTTARDDTAEPVALAEAPAPEEAPGDTAPPPGEEPPAPEDEALADGQIMPPAEPAPSAGDEAAADGAAMPAEQPAAPAEAPLPETSAGTGAAPVLLPGAQDEIILSSMDQPPPATDALALAEPQAAAEAAPQAPAPPPPFGTQYEFDENGLIRPTAAGIVSPEGVRLVAGRPPVVPPPRPEGIMAPALPAAAEPALPGAEAPAAQPYADPALEGFRPRPRPEGLGPETAADDAALAIPTAQRMVSLHPRARPAAIAALAEQRRLDDEARRVAEAASLSAAAAAEALAATAPQEEAAAPAGPVSPLAIAISRHPPQRPKDLSKAVAAAVAATAARPAPEAQPEAEAPAAARPPEPKPEKVAAAEPAPAKRNFAKAVPGEDEEPEIAAAAKAPKIPSNASVAKNATFKNAIDLGKTNLIGVYGTPAKRYALIRTGSGQYKKVRVGDRVDGGTIAAITDSEVRYKKGSRIVALKMPKG